MLRQRAGIAFRAQPVQEPRRPLDVGENEGDGPRRQSPMWTGSAPAPNFPRSRQRGCAGRVSEEVHHNEVELVFRSGGLGFSLMPLAAIRDFS